MMRYLQMIVLVGISVGLRHMLGNSMLKSLVSVAGVLLIGVILGCAAAGPAHTGLAPAPDEGIKISNGDIGVMLWGPNNRPTFNVGKTDVWDRRYIEKAPVVTLAQIKQWAKTGDFPGRWYKSYEVYDFPCPKPVGQLIVGLPGVEAEWAVEAQGAGAGGLTLTATRGEQRLDLRVYVHAARTLIVLEGDAHQGIDGLWFRVYRHRDTLVLGEVHASLGASASKTYDYSQDEGNGPMEPPTSGHESDLGWIAQVFPAEPTFPEGFHYTFAAVTSVPGVRVGSVEGRRGLGTPASSKWEGRSDPETGHHGVYKRYQPINKANGAAATFHLPRVEGHFQVLATVVTSTEGEDTLALARSRLQEALPESPSERSATHQAATQDPRYPYLTRQPGGYYGPAHTAYCCQDSAPWHSDFHLDEALNYRDYFIGNRVEQLAPYFQLIEQILPAAKNNAREVYDMPGAMFGVVHFPIRTERICHVNVVWEQCMERNAQISKPFWEHYLYTGDEEFLRNRTYPLLREGARFYAAYLTLEEDMYYHVFPTVSPEHWRLTKDFLRNKDSQSALTFIKYHLTAAAQAAEILGEDEEEREFWAHIAANMAPYPTYETPDGPIFVDVLGAPPIQYNVAVPLTAIFWGDDITLDSPPEVLEIARRTIGKIDVWRPHRGYISLARRSLGEYPGGGISEQSVLQSRGGWDMVNKIGGWIRVFPAVPGNYTGSFSNYLATGAFEVSAACKNGTVTELTIRSRVGNTCQLINPWPGQTLLVKEVESGEAARLAGGHVRFPTRAGQTYLIEPATP